MFWTIIIAGLFVAGLIFRHKFRSDDRQEEAGEDAGLAIVEFGRAFPEEAIRAVDRKMTALDRFVARNTFIEVDPATWLTKPTDTLQLGHVAVIEKQDVATKRKHRFTFLVTTHGETATDPDSGIECLPHNSPLAVAALGLRAKQEAKVTLPAGEALLTVHSIRNPTQAELDRVLTAIAPPEVEGED